MILYFNDISYFLCNKVGNGRYVDDVDELLARADIISIHVPLLPQTRHLINEENIKKSVFHLH